MSSNLESYGWNPAWAEALAALVLPEAEPGRVVRVDRGVFLLQTGNGPLEAVPAGRLRHLAEGADEWLAVGDWVAYERPDATGLAVVQAVLPRRTKLSRKVAGARAVEQVVAANVDAVFVVMGLDGDYNLRRLERFLVMVREAGLRPVVVLNKADLCAELEERVAAAEAVAAPAAVRVTAATEGAVEAIRPELVPGETIALVGSSGVGKSTLINELAGESSLRTGTVRERDERGQHTTTYRELVRLPGGCLLIDNPGVRELQPWTAEDGLDETFEDVLEVAQGCRFRDCEHEGEPGCAVRAAISEGRLAAARLSQMRALEAEARALAARRDARARRQAERKLGKLYRSVQASKRGRREE